jgi:hypothetical protein
MAVPGAAFAHNTPKLSNDIDVLNYALTLEHLEAVFHTQGPKKFDDDDFGMYFENNRPFRKQGIKELDGEAVHEAFVLIREYAQTYVKTLQSMIRSLGASPCPSAPTTSRRPPSRVSGSLSPSRSSSRTRASRPTTGR